MRGRFVPPEPCAGGNEPKMDPIEPRALGAPNQSLRKSVMCLFRFWVGAMRAEQRGADETKEGQAAWLRGEGEVFKLNRGVGATLMDGGPGVTAAGIEPHSKEGSAHSLDSD